MGQMTQPHSLQRYEFLWGIVKGIKTNSVDLLSTLPLTLISYYVLHIITPTNPCLMLTSLQLWHLLLLERPFTADRDSPDSEHRLPGGRLTGFGDLGGLGGGSIGGSVPTGLGGSMGGLLGSGDTWGQGRPPRLSSQRRYRSRGSSRPDRSPAVEG